MPILDMKKQLTHGSLFSGIGGFDLAAEWMGWKNIFHCEWNDFGKRILKYYWPNSISYDDITKTDFTIHRGTIDILSGGFPCQPYSVAGLQKGKEDERHLWPEMLRAIGEIQPRWVVGENVLGIVNWSGGLVFEEVQSDLEAKGYEVFTFILPAIGVNAPHRRVRTWFIAHAKSQGSGGELFERPKQGKFRGCDSENDTAHANGRRQPSKEHRQKETGRASKESVSNDWANFPIESPICNGNDGFSERLDGITFPKWRNESIKGGGNAIVPQVAMQIFKAIEEYESHFTNKTVIG